METIISIATLVSSGSAAIGLLLVWGQMRKASEANKISRALLDAQIDAYTLATHEMILSAERHVAECRREFLHSLDRLSAANQTSSTEATEGAHRSMLAHREGYYNALDRFCGLIREGFIDEEVAKRRYRDDLLEIVRNDPDKFGAGTQYPNMARVVDAWGDSSKSAIDLKRNRAPLALPPPT